MTEKFSKTFTLSQKAWEFLNELKFKEQKNISAYVNALIIRDLEKKRGEHKQC